MHFNLDSVDASEEQIDKLVTNVNNQLKDAFKVASMRDFKIQRLTNDYTSSQTLSRTCKLSGKGGKKGKGRLAILLVARYCTIMENFSTRPKFTRIITMVKSRLTLLKC